MKTLASIVLLLSCTIACMAQDKNESLYKAIMARDKNQVNAMLIQSANPNFVKSISRMNKTNMVIAAVKAGDSEIVQMLIDHNADLDWKDGFSRTAVMYAAALNKINIVQLLLESGANVLANDGKDYDVLAAAKSSNNDELIGYVEDKVEAAKEKKKPNK